MDKYILNNNTKYYDADQKNINHFVLYVGNTRLLEQGSAIPLYKDPELKEMFTDNEALKHMFEVGLVVKVIKDDTEDMIASDLAIIPNLISKTRSNIFNSDSEMIWAVGFIGFNESTTNGVTWLTTAKVDTM